MDKACEKIEACEECCEDDALGAGAEQGYAFGICPAGVLAASRDEVELDVHALTFFIPRPLINGSSG